MVMQLSCKQRFDNLIARLRSSQLAVDSRSKRFFVALLLLSMLETREYLKSNNGYRNHERLVRWISNRIVKELFRLQQYQAMPALLADRLEFFEELFERVDSAYGDRSGAEKFRSLWIDFTTKALKEGTHG